MATIRFTIPGDPNAQRRHRIVKVAKFARLHQDARDGQWKGGAQMHMLDAMGDRAPFSGPVRLVLRAFWALPKSAERKRDPRPAERYPVNKDADNVAKSLMDAGNGVLYVDDRQVVVLVVEKWRAAQSEPGRIEVEIEEIDG